MIKIVPGTSSVGLCKPETQGSFMDIPLNRDRKVKCIDLICFSPSPLFCLKNLCVTTSIHAVYISVLVS